MLSPVPSTVARRSGAGRLVAILGLAACGCLGMLSAAATGSQLVRPRPSVAFNPAGDSIAAGGYREVTLFSRNGRVLRRLAAPDGPVNAVGFSPDGSRLAAAGGVPGVSGDIRVWDTKTWTAQSITGIHKDSLYGLAWSPNGNRLAVCGYDRLVSVWDVRTGEGRELKDHTDAVYSVAFSPDGRQVASASGDRTVKVWDVEKGERVFTLSDATAELYAVAWHPKGEQIAAAGVDKMIRRWSVTPTAGNLARASFAHDGPVLRLAYTPDGAGLWSSAEDRSVKLWDSAALTETRVLPKQPDWPLGLSVSKDGARVAVSRYDGTLAIYDAETGKPAPEFVAGGE